MPRRATHSNLVVILGWIVFFGVLCPIVGAQTESEVSKPFNLDFWNSHVEPVLNRNCFKCHGGVKQKGGLDLRTIDSILKGGDSGAIVVPRVPEASLIFQYIQPESDPHMPPDEDKQLSSDEIALIGAWIRNYLPGTGSAQGEAYENTASDSSRAGEINRRPKWIPSWTMSPEKVINRFARYKWKEQGIRRGAVCNDAAFVRRVYLDLVGRIPTVDEANAFVRSKSSDKRAGLVENLLASDAYARHMREIFDFVLMDGRGGRPTDREDNGWYEFLESSFRSNRPWNEIVRALVLARPANSKERGAPWFLYERKNNHQAMAEAIAPVAFGIQVKCAQCHNHPLAHEIKQRHYWGLVAAMNRSKNIETQNGIGIAESAIGGFVKFTNLANESQPAELAFPNGFFVKEIRPEEGEKEVDDPEKYLVPPPAETEKPLDPPHPKFSRREKLAQAVTSGNPDLARSFVNRIWALLVGRGFVHPVDEMDSTHSISHPELLDWLARDFERGGYDMRRLIRSIVLSLPYQLDSRPRIHPTPPQETFSVGLEKPLSAEVLYRSMLIATGNTPDEDGNLAGVKEGELRAAFESLFPEPFSIQYNATLPQALFLSNSPILNKLLEPRDDNTVARLLELPTASERVCLAFSTVLGRAPDQVELEESIRFFANYESHPERGIQSLLWALLASAEFQINH